MLVLQDPRRYKRDFQLKLGDLEKLDSVRGDLHKFLQEHPDVDRSHPFSVELTNFSGSTFDIGVEVSLQPVQAVLVPCACKT